MSFSLKLNFFILYVFTFVYLVSTSKNPNNLEKKQINECGRCKLVTKSFNYWLEKTSRGTHEGGDAAWEEAKLKFYARSEMRLVEIQENLCSDLKEKQNDCYGMLEKADQYLENWWLHEAQQEDSQKNLFRWLCIDNLKYCCPENHYGDLCDACPRADNNKICGGRGKCNGDGTRQGDGSCICRKGYTGTICDKCEKNYFFNSSNETCEPCHHACSGCHGDGAHSCTKCATGWAMEERLCIDINECLYTSICNTNEYCENRDGYYLCKPCDKTCESCIGPGLSGCSSCHASHILIFGKCINYDFKINILKKVPPYMRLVIYSFPVILVLVVSKSKFFTSLLVLTISMLIFYLETIS